MTTIRLRNRGLVMCHEARFPVSKAGLVWRGSTVRLPLKPGFHGGDAGSSASVRAGGGSVPLCNSTSVRYLEWSLEFHRWGGRKALCMVKLTPIPDFTRHRNFVCWPDGCCWGRVELSLKASMAIHSMSVCADSHFLLKALRAATLHCMYSG
jgi:hypothetical protein